MLKQGAIIWEDPDNGIGNCCVKDLRNEDDPCVTEVAFDDPDVSAAHFMHLSSIKEILTEK